MKFAILFSFVLALVVPVLPASESALDCQAAVDTLAAGIEVHPIQAVVLFQDALQTNPGCRQQLLMAAIQLTGGEATVLTRLIYAARIEFPEDDNLFAEAAMTVAPESGAEIRDAFMKSPAEMGKALAIGSAEVMADSEALVEHTTMDEEIRDAIARMAAKAEGKPWPEQKLSEEPLHFRKPDEIRVPRESAGVDETSLANGLFFDKDDERGMATFPVHINDTWKPSTAIRLDESKFESGDRTASMGLLDARKRSVAPAGVAPGVHPVLKNPSMYSLSPSSESYHSTIDIETGEEMRPTLIIRPPANPSIGPE